MKIVAAFGLTFHNSGREEGYVFVVADDGQTWSHCVTTTGSQWERETPPIPAPEPAAAEAR